ncbi:MAG TPA: hypothetical protein VEU74_04415, partial [Gemmatimonadales bacterium]|nr:hypothetical protein [Gemmatimonadales bacterium]
MIGLWSQVADSVIHSDTVAIVGIVAGVVGTLLGATVGLLGSWWIQKRQLEHEDETRFHDRRLAVYAEFNDACGKLVSAKQVNADIATVNQHLSRVLIAWENLRLIASGPVVAAARPIHA